MRITLLTYGSRGDFEPFLALAVGLQKAGHEPMLAGPQRFADFSAQYHVPFTPLPGDLESLSRQFNDAGSNVFRMVAAMQKHVFAIAPEVVKIAREACRNADLVIHSFLFTTGAHSFAREWGIPDVSLQIFPMFAATRAFPNVAFGDIKPGNLSYFTHWLAEKVFWVGGNGGYRQLRRKRPQDLPARLYWPFTKVDSRPLSPLLFAWSPVVLPRPAEWTSTHIHLPGYLFLDSPEYQPPEELLAFLARGEAPVCISFSSMVNRERERIGRTVLEGLKRTGQRGLILTGWNGWKPDHAPADVLFLESVPHTWLFERCKVIVHHGGAGMTAAGLRSGRPSLVVPFMADQPFWGKRVASLGAGPAPIPVKRFSPESFTGALQMALADPGILTRAAEIGSALQAEDGIGNAVRLIENAAEEFKTVLASA